MTELTAADLAQLAREQRSSVSLPRVQRRSTNPFIDQLRASYERREAFSLPPVPESDVRRVSRALRRAAELASLGVSIRRQATPFGVVLHYQARLPE